ncbi:37045_t:CDS:2, partial [Gigaspora margarita]
LKSQLIQVFTQYDSTKLFKNATEYTTEGFNNLFTCYNISIERLKIIHSQEITKEIPYTTKGRRQKNVRTNMISQQIKTEKHRKEIEKLTRSLHKKLIELNELSAEETSRVLVEICTLSDTKPENWDLKRI